ncbi:unnamed protein product [Closterium sp. NIES-65]|nr:unnamed protein product [Closterium sp. NIES-65]
MWAFLVRAFLVRAFLVRASTHASIHAGKDALRRCGGRLIYDAVLALVSPSASNHPELLYPSWSVSLPSRSVSLPSRSVSLPSRSVSLPSRSVSLPSRSVSLPSPSVSLPSRSVSLPSPSVSLPHGPFTRPACVVSLLYLDGPHSALDSNALSRAAFPPPLSFPSTPAYEARGHRLCCTHLYHMPLAPAAALPPHLTPSPTPPRYSRSAFLVALFYTVAVHWTAVCSRHAAYGAIASAMLLPPSPSTSFLLLITCFTVVPSPPIAHTHPYHFLPPTQRPCPPHPPNVPALLIHPTSLPSSSTQRPCPPHPPNVPALLIHPTSLPSSSSRLHCPPPCSTFQVAHSAWEVVTDSHLDPSAPLFNLLHTML